MKTCIKENDVDEENRKKNCKCLLIDYENKKQYIDFCVDKFNISDTLEHTLHLSTKEQLKGFIKHYYNFDIENIESSL